MPTPHYGQPRYRTIADALKQRIESGIITPGALLPAESSLSSEFKASRGTIRQALAVLRKEGVVSTEHGRGTYADRKHAYYDSDRGASPRMTKRVISANAELADLFGIEAGSSLIEEESIARVDARIERVTRVYRLPEG